jgi:tryptophan synthase
MGVTGSSANATMSASLPELCARVRKYAGKTPIAVGFGVNTREHFLSVSNIADGVVIGSKIVSLIKEAQPGTITDTIRAYCMKISRPRSQHEQNGVSHRIGRLESVDMAKVDAVSAPTGDISRPDSEAKGSVDELRTLPGNGNEEYEVLQSRAAANAIENPHQIW